MRIIGHTILNLDTAERFVRRDYISARSYERAAVAFSVLDRLFGKDYNLRIATIDETGKLTPLYPERNSHVRSLSSSHGS